MVVGLSSWIGVEFLIILGVETTNDTLPDRIFNLENHLRHVVTDFLDIELEILTLKSAGSLVPQAEASEE